MLSLLPVTNWANWQEIHHLNVIVALALSTQLGVMTTQALRLPWLLKR